MTPGPQQDNKSPAQDRKVFAGISSAACVLFPSLSVPAVTHMIEISPSTTGYYIVKGLPTAHTLLYIVMHFVIVHLFIRAVLDNKVIVGNGKFRSII